MSYISGYDPLTIINNLLKLDGTTLGDKNQFLSYTLAAYGRFRSPYLCGSTTLYPDHVASILLIGVKYANGGLTPQIIEANVSTFMTTVGGATVDPYSNASSVFSDTNPMSSNYASPNMQMSGANITTDSLNIMNVALSNSVNGIGTKTLTGKYIRKPSEMKYWHQDDQNYAGYSTSATDSATTTAVNNQRSKYENGTSELALLFYTMALVDELQARHGYRIPDTTRPYSPYNWLKVSDTGKTSSGVTTFRYFKILYLTEADLYVHAECVDNPSLLAGGFVGSDMFNRIIKSKVTN